MSLVGKGLLALKHVKLAQNRSACQTLKTDDMPLHIGLIGLDMFRPSDIIFTYLAKAPPPPL